jgi:hypothetical protein
MSKKCSGVFCSEVAGEIPRIQPAFGSYAENGCFRLIFFVDFDQRFIDLKRPDLAVKGIGADRAG